MSVTETIGICEWCGCMDHHLVHATCPSCLPRVIQHGFDEEGQPLGADAGVYIPRIELPGASSACGDEG